MKCSNIRIIGVPEGEEEEQKIENLFEQIMKENFPSLAKEIDISLLMAYKNAADFRINFVSCHLLNSFIISSSFLVESLWFSV